MHELQHRFLKLRLAHLPVTDADACAGRKFLNQGGPRPDGIYPVVKELGLPAAR
jgi:hypothetical protein